MRVLSLSAVVATSLKCTVNLLPGSASFAFDTQDFALPIERQDSAQQRCPQTLS